MADEEQSGFWRRLRSKWAGASGRPPKPSEDSSTPGHTPVANDSGTTHDDEDPKDPSSVDEPGPVSKTPSQPTPAEDGETSVLSTTELKTDSIGRVYAQSLLDLAQEQDQVDALAEQMQQLLPVLDEDGELDRMMDNPSIGQAERKQIVKRVFEGKVSDLLYRFIQVIADKDRLDSLPQIVAGFLILVAEHRGQLEVEAFVASKLDPATAERVAKTIGEHLGKQVTLRQHVDESLIGGLKIKIGDRLIDASVASQLQSMKNKMIAATRG